MVKLILLLFIFRIDPNPKTIDTFDIIEVNHTYNKWGGEGLVQVITLDWIKHHNRFHVQWYKVMENCFIKTEEDKKKWDEERRKDADKIKDWMKRLDFLNCTSYRGKFNSMHNLYPEKNWRTGYWEIKFDNRIVRAKIFRETYTGYDVEVVDRKKFNIEFRRGLTKKPSTEEEEVPDYLNYDFSWFKNIINNTVFGVK